MRARIQVALKTSTQARAVTQRDWLTSYLSTHPALAHISPAALNADGWQAFCDVSFDLDSDAEAMLAALQTRWAAVAQIQAGSFVQKHLCRHDEPEPPPCVVSTLAVK